ncbi:BnaA03g00450D [Brassica napus]|uniref:BnaA03g00450D protein n=1 Tax=Brassica napus TaxID=3708 RepID=A0A078FE37_BRANA|nr:BnaA03g00450D [Brassica napus]
MMIGGTLTSSSSSSSSTAKIILEAFPAEMFRRGGASAEIFPRKTSHLKLLRVDSVHGRILKPSPLRSSSIKANIEEEDAETEASPGRTVRVRFQLRKECVFGEHFFILGDHPVFGGGLWDPENALPLNWSDGHVWTLDLELPVGRLVEFKFILKAQTGEILWQPGPNRAIETWETSKTIRICEDWENADLQMMREEDFVPFDQEEEQHVTLLTDASSNGAEEEVEVLDAVQQISSVVIVENEGYVSDDEPEENSSGALSACQDGNVIEEAMFSEEESPVLVPGLFPPSDLDSEEVIEVINEGKAETFPEVDKKQGIKRERNDKEKIKAVTLFEKSEQEAVKGEEKMNYNAAEEEQQQQGLETEALLGTPHVLLEKDIQWGRRKLYKLLSNFGLF